jgi:hypothetical protein
MRVVVDGTAASGVDARVCPADQLPGVRGTEAEYVGHLRIGVVEALAEDVRGPFRRGVSLSMSTRSASSTASLRSTAVSLVTSASATSSSQGVTATSCLALADWRTLIARRRAAVAMNPGGFSTARRSVRCHRSHVSCTTSSASLMLPRIF